MCQIEKNGPVTKYGPVTLIKNGYQKMMNV